MEPDYPAAHSMDTTWYAVDAAGHVGVFSTGENGHAPVGSKADGKYFLDRLYRDRRPNATADDYWPDEHLATELGFFLYDYADGYDPIDVFERRVVPGRPIHVDELPPEIRAACKKTRLPVQFAAAERVQPLEYFRCEYWYDEDRIGYLAADGVTVRPIRGRESRFAEFVRRFRESFPDAAAHYRFEGVPDVR